eukprot:scaffold3068_cov269-Pinguiococcus_pyrenoidosus.AAC.6
MVADGARHDVEVLQPSLVALVNVDPVVATEQRREILGIDGASKELDPIIKVVGHLDVVNNGPSAHARQRDAINLVVKADDRSTIPDADISQHA